MPESFDFKFAISSFTQLEGKENKQALIVQQ